MKKAVIIFMINFVCLHFSFGQCCDVRMFDICTPMGSTVSTWLTYEASTYTRKSKDDYYSSKHPDAEMIIVYDSLSSTRKFNCHGYAWLREEGGPDRWINLWLIEAAQDIYMTDGSYIEVPVETYPGKVYWPGNHSAITTEEPGWVISKWGRGPLMKHRWDESEYAAVNLKYYVKAPTPTPVVNFTNQIVTTNTTVTSNGNIFVQNVKVKNGAKLIFEAAGNVNIISDFDVDLGSEFEIR